MSFWRNKKIVVTGGSGFLGSYVVKKLHERGVLEKDLVIPRSKDTDLREWENCVRAVKGADIVLHLAGKVGGIGFNRRYPATLYYENIIMGVQLLEAARQAGVSKVVVLGTVCAYPKYTSVPFREEDLWNGYPEETNAPYGLAKKLLLVQAQAYRRQYGSNIIYLLPVNLYGPGDSFDVEKSHVIPALIRRFIEAVREGKKDVMVWGTGKPSREFLYVEDAAEAILLATERYDKSEPVNIGGGFEITIRDLVRLIAELTGFRGHIQWDTSRPDGQPRRRLDVTRAEKEFGFKASTSLREGLVKTIAWYKAQPVFNGQ